MLSIYEKCGSESKKSGRDDGSSNDNLPRLYVVALLHRVHMQVADYSPDMQSKFSLDISASKIK